MEPLREQTYAEFSLRLHSEIVKRRVPASAEIELSHRCPLSCSHCYNNRPIDDAEALRGELTRDEHCRILDELAEAGCLWLLFTGGEIFARPDFLEIYAHARRKGFLITLFTNGTLVTPRIADFLAERRPFAIEITIYGATAETYERVTGKSGSYDRCMRGIRLLLDRGLPLALKTMATSVNRHEIGAMHRLAEQLGTPFKFDAMLNPRIDCSGAPLALRLTPSEIVQLDLDYPRRVAEWRRFSDGFCGAPENPDDVYRCGAGNIACAIDPEGRLSLCALSRAERYDLRRGSFREGWDQFLYRARQGKITRVTKCTQCHIQSLCGMCPAMGELENKDPEAPVDFLCRVAHLRANAMNIPVPPHGDCEYCAGPYAAPPAVVMLNQSTGGSETRPA
jgi:radical SAM protein with 4Fe4S-binding SPASM domain